MKVTKRSAKALQALVIFMAIALVATAIPAVLYAGLPQAAAAEASASNETQLRAALADSNNTKVTLTADISLTMDRGSNGAGIRAYHDSPRLVVPAGNDIELNLNGHSIRWETNDNEDNLYDAFASDAWPANDYANATVANGGYKYMLLDNKGTLRITGNGTISSRIDTWVSSTLKNKDRRAASLCTIRNSGSLTIDSSVNISCNLGYEAPDNGGYCVEVYLTAIGIYQTGGSVNFGGNITTVCRAQGQYGNTWHKSSSGVFASAYGIYGAAGPVIYQGASGKKISVTTYTGFFGTSGESEDNCLQGTAIGIYTTSGESKIIGANIDCSASYADDINGSSGQGGVLKKFYQATNAIGVAYSTDIIPTVGSGTNITTTTGVEASTEYSGDHPLPRKYPVLKLDNAPLNLFNPQAVPGKTNWMEWSAWSGANPTTDGQGSGVGTYKDENGNIWNPKVVVSNGQRCSSQTSEPVNDPAQNDTNMTGGVPASAVATTHKVLVAYRYYDSNHQLEDVILKNEDVAKKSNAVSLGNVTSGRVDLTRASTIKFNGGGTPKNEYFHKLTGISYSATGSGNVSSTWATSGNGGIQIARMNNGELETVRTDIPATTGQTTLIYVDYTAIPTDTIRCNINNSSMLDVDNRIAEVEYKGTAPVFGSDIRLNVYKCMRQDDDLTAERPYANDIDITSRFATIANGTNRVTYDVYNTDNQKIQTNSLPSAPGAYTVKMNFAGEETYNASAQNSMNFGSGTFDFTLIIRPRNVTITQNGIPEITYGQTLGSLKTSDLNNYFTIDTGIAGLTADGNFEWVTPNEMPEVGEHTYQLKWVSPQGYFETQVLDSVKVKVNKANLTVTAKNKDITYGQALELTADDFTFAGLANKDGEKDTVFAQIKNTVRVDGAEYVSGAFDAGLHHYALSATGTANYNITNNAGDLNIGKAPLVITAPAVTKEYDGNATVDITFDASSIISGLIDEYGANGVTIDKYVAAPLANGGKVGQTTATVIANQVKLSGFKKDNYVVSAVTNANSVPVNIVKAAPVTDILTIENTSVTYDPTKTLAGFENLVPADPENGYIKVVAVGDKTADGRLATPGKWVWKNNEKPTVANKSYVAEFRPDDENYATKEQAVEISVAPRTITVAVAMSDVFYGDDQPSGTYTFTGFPAGSPERINANGSTFNAVGFTLSGNLFYACTYDPNSSDNKNAGTYPISLVNTLSADNYTFAADPNCALTVKDKDLIITPVQKSVVYGTTLQQSDFSFTATGLVAGDEALQAQLNASYIFDVSSTTDVGEYELNVAFGNKIPNYNIIVNPGKIVVTKALVTVEADDIEVTYGGTPVYTYKYSGFKGTDANNIGDIVTGEPTFSSNYSTSSKAGETFSIIVGVNGLSAKNYAFQASSKVSLLTVVTGKVNVTAWPTFEVENGKDLSAAVLKTNGTAITADGREINGTFRVDNRDAVLEYKNNNKPINDVSVTFYPADTNYESVQGKASVIVTPRAISGQPTISGTLMEGERISLDISTLDPNNMDYYDPNTIVWTIGTRTVQAQNSILLTRADIGKTVTVSIEPYSDSGFSGAATYTTTIRVSEGLPIPGLEQLSIPQTTVETTYDKSAHKFTVEKANQNIGQLTVRYNGSTEAPIAAGTYIVTVDIGTAASGQFAPVSGLKVGTLIINPRPITVSFSAVDKTYDGKTNASVQDFDASVGIISGDNVSVNRTAATYNFVDANAGDGIEVVMNYAYLEGTAKDNYVIKQETVYANIFPKEITAVAYATEQNYDENNYTVNEITFGTPTGVLAIDKSGIVLNKTTGSMGTNAAGTQDVTYIEYDGVLAGSKANNYTFTASNESTLKVNILQVRDPNMEWPQAIEVSYSSLQRLDDLSGDLPFGWTWDDPTVVPTVRVKTYNATYTPANSSYKTESYRVVINVKPVEVTVVPDTHYLTYGAPVPTLTYSVEGFTGDDDVTDCAGMIVVQTNYVQGADVTNANAYRVWVNRSTISNPNYTFNLSTEGKINVGKRDYIVTPAADSVVYDPNNHNVTVTFTGEGAYVDPNRGPDDVELSYNSVQGRLENNNAGTRPVTYELPKLEGSKAGNYELKVSGAAITVQVLKADPVVTFPTSATVEYGQRFSTAVFDGGVGEGSFMFVDSSKTASELQSAYYEVRFTPTDSRNYNSVTQPVLLQVSTAELKIGVSISGTLYEGQTLTAAVSGVPQDALQYLHYAWYRVNEDGTEILVSDASTYELGAQDIGYYIRLSVTTDPTAPYQGSADFKTVRTIEEEKLTLWQKIMKWWYAILAAIQSIFDTLGGR